MSFNLGDIIIPKEKETLVQKGYDEVEQVVNNYNMGFITNKRTLQPGDRYLDTCKLGVVINILMKDNFFGDQGFNSVYMMLDSGARGSKEQIRQLSGMRGFDGKTAESRC